MTRDHNPSYSLNMYQMSLAERSV